MRRFALLWLVAGAALFAAACSSDQGQGPSEPSLEQSEGPQADLQLRCRQDGLIILQLAAILPTNPPKRLFQQAVQQFAMVELALLTRKKPLAQQRALVLIDFLADNRANLIKPETPATLTRLGNVIDAILCVVGLPPTGVSLDSNTGVGVVPANNPTPVIITTPQGDAGIKVPTGGAPSTDVSGRPITGIVVTVTTTNVGPLDTPLDQYGRTIDLNASEEVIWQAGGVTVAICVTEDLLPALFDRLRIGHEGGLPANRFGAIEILPPANAGDVGDVVGGCTSGLGSASPFDGLRDFAKRMLLPRDLHAAALVKTGGVGGLASRFSKFGPVDPQLQLVALPTSTTGVAGAPVAQPPSVLVRTALLTPIQGINVTFAVPSGSPGTVTPGAAATNADGVAATTSWVLGNGTNTVVATPQQPIPAITFVPPSVSFTATGAPDTPNYGASNWSYRILPAAPETTDWTTLPWPVTATGWAQGTAPFGSVTAGETSPSGCNDLAATDGPLNQAILLRRDFFVPAGTSEVSIAMKIDNDIRVFLNGVELTDGPRTHEGCAETNLLTPLTVEGSPLVVGVNQLAVLGVDRGTESYVDVQVTLGTDE